MGGLKKYMPVTFATMTIACLAISGLPPFAGFFSKDEILYEEFASGNVVLWIVAMITAFMTAFYMFRLLFLTFFGEERMTHEAKHHLHESPPSMTVPLQVLAVLSVIGGWINLPLIRNGHRLRAWLEPSRGAGHEGIAHVENSSVEVTLMVVSVLVALAGTALAWLFYVKSPGLPKRVAAALGGLYRGALNKWYVDEIYDYVIVKPLVGASQFLWRVWDTWVIDGTVNLIGATVSGTGALLRLFQTGYVGTYAFGLVIGVLVILGGAVWRGHP